MFIARQPIFDQTMQVYGYELLYRDSETAQAFKNTSAEQATATVLSGLFELGIDNISNNRRSFINFDYDFIFSDTIELIEPEKLIIEILEDTIVDDKLIERLKELKSKGYHIALDDFVEDYESYGLVPLARIIKYDLMATPLHTITGEVKRALRDGKVLLAEKVETKEEYQMAKKMGFHLYQGYFFEKPNIIGKTHNKKSPKLSYIEILKELKQPEPSYRRLTDIFKKDVNLSYRLLRGTKEADNQEDLVNNIEKALLFMGLNQIERWINILMLQDLASDKPLELTRLSLIRSHFGEFLAKASHLRKRSNEVYGMLLFSTLNALLDQPMEEALAGISVSDDVKQALISGKGDLNPILQLVYCYEKGAWEEVKQFSEQLGLDAQSISAYYMKSIIAVEDILATN